jgi:hypothetical protein
MHPEIEKLIDLAIADGQITEKERNVILRKAAEFGVDPDEVEVILDGKLHKLEVSKPKRSEKVGIIKTCPSCGAFIKGTSLACDACGLEFSNTNSNSSFIELEGKLLAAKGTKERVRIVSDHPIPNDKETLFDLLSFCSGKVLSADSETDAELTNAFHSRAIEIITKLRLICSDDSALIAELNGISKRMNNKKGKNGILRLLSTMGFIFLSYLMYALIARIFGAHWWPF